MSKAFRFAVALFK